jgi:hypothetical protein
VSPGGGVAVADETAGKFADGAGHRTRSRAGLGQ